MDRDIYIIGGDTGGGVTGAGMQFISPDILIKKVYFIRGPQGDWTMKCIPCLVELYHNTMFVSDEDVMVTDAMSYNKSEIDIASMNTPRTEAEGVFR